MKIVVKCFLRSVDADFAENLQSVNRKYQSFQEEATLAHRQHLEDHILDQKAANLAIHSSLCVAKRNSNDGENLILPGS